MNIDLFVTCLTDEFYPRVGRAVVGVLDHLGHKVDCPSEQTCCGQPMYNSGCHDDAAKLARRMIRIFGDSELVVTPSGSCCAMIHDYYEDLLKDNPAEAAAARELAAKTHEFVQFLVNVLKVDLRQLGCKWPTNGNAVKTTYHYSCHGRGIGLKDEAVQLLQQIEGIRYTQMEKFDQCCGFGGIFSVKRPETAGAMVRDKVKCIIDSGAELVICNDAGCTMNISGALHREGHNVPVVHLAEIIAIGLGLLEPTEELQAIMAK